MRSPIDQIPFLAELLLLRRGGSRYSCTTDGKQGRRRRASVIPCRYRLLRRLKPSYREEDTRGHSKMVRSARPIDKSQHCVDGLSRGIGHMALWAQRIHGLDVNRFPPMGSWKTYVLPTFPAQLAPDGFFNLCSGLWEERHLVCRSF